jgi:hypothetical protein
MMTNNMSDVDFFNEWFNTFGVRTYHKGSPAEQHRSYMASAFLAGYHTCEKNDRIIAELREEIRRLKDHLNCNMA